MTYDIIYQTALDALKEQVNKKLQEGWKPCGGVCVTYCPIPETNLTSHIRYSQAITKE